MSTPAVAHVEVVPVAGYDSMLLNLSGAHGPFFTRNVAILTDSEGRVGVGEVPGGDAIAKTIADAGAMLVGRPVARYASLLRSIADAYAGRDAGGRGVQTFDQRTTVHAVTALESCLLDLFGQYLGVPVSELLGEGRQRDSVPVLGYLFYVGDRRRTDLPYIAEDASADDWTRLRRELALTSEAVVALAKAARAPYGFADFKLNGGCQGPPHPSSTRRPLRRRRRCRAGREALCVRQAAGRRGSRATRWWVGVSAGRRCAGPAARS